MSQWLLELIASPLDTINPLRVLEQGFKNTTLVKAGVSSQSRQAFVLLHSYKKRGGGGRVPRISRWEMVVSLPQECRRASWFLGVKLATLLPLQVLGWRQLWGDGR